MFFYIAFVASGSLGALITVIQLIGALANPSIAPEVPVILKDFDIDLGAVSLFAFLYYRENQAKHAQLSRLSREESLSNLKLRVGDKKIIPVSTLRGFARLVICAGPTSFITESLNRSEPFTESLLERGVLLVPLVTDGNSPSLEFEESEEQKQKQLTTRRKRLWQLAPLYITEWFEWLDEQRKLAGVSSESPVLSITIIHVLVSISAARWSSARQWGWLSSMERFGCTITTSKGNLVWLTRWHGWESPLEEVYCERLSLAIFSLLVQASAS